MRNYVMTNNVSLNREQFCSKFYSSSEGEMVYYSFEKTWTLSQSQNVLEKKENVLISTSLDHTFKRVYTLF